MIYAAEVCRMQFVKIGYAVDVSARLSQLQTGNPHKINCLFSIPGTLLQEQALHQALTVAFARIRIPMPPNEWYPGRHPVMAEFLGNLKYGFDLGLAAIERFNPAIKQPGTSKRGDAFTPNFLWQ